MVLNVNVILFTQVPNYCMSKMIVDNTLIRVLSTII
jgi:hypothetical protein